MKDIKARIEALESMNKSHAQVEIRYKDGVIRRVSVIEAFQITNDKEKCKDVESIVTHIDGGKNDLTTEYFNYFLTHDSAIK